MQMCLGLLTCHPPDLPLALRRMHMSRLIACFTLGSKEYASAERKRNIVYIRYNYFSVYTAIYICSAGQLSLLGYNSNMAHSFICFLYMYFGVTREIGQVTYGTFIWIHMNGLTAIYVTGYCWPVGQSCRGRQWGRLNANSKLNGHQTCMTFIIIRN